MDIVLPSDDPLAVLLQRRSPQGNAQGNPQGNAQGNPQGNPHGANTGVAPLDLPDLGSSFASSADTATPLGSTSIHHGSFSRQGSAVLAHAQGRTHHHAHGATHMHRAAAVARGRAARAVLDTLRYLQQCPASVPMAAVTKDPRYAAALEALDAARDSAAAVARAVPATAALSAFTLAAIASRALAGLPRWVAAVLFGAALARASLPAATATASVAAVAAVWRCGRALCMVRRQFRRSMEASAVRSGRSLAVPHSWRHHALLPPDVHVCPLCQDTASRVAETAAEEPMTSEMAATARALRALRWAGGSVTVRRVGNAGLDDLNEATALVVHICGGLGFDTPPPRSARGSTTSSPLTAKAPARGPPPPHLSLWRALLPLLHAARVMEASSAAAPEEPATSSPAPLLLGADGFPAATAAEVGALLLRLQPSHPADPAGRRAALGDMAAAARRLAGFCDHALAEKPPAVRETEAPRAEMRAVGDAVPADAAPAPEEDLEVVMPGCDPHTPAVEPRAFEPRPTRLPVVPAALLRRARPGASETLEVAGEAEREPEPSTTDAGPKQAMQAELRSMFRKRAAAKT